MKKYCPFETMSKHHQGIKDKISLALFMECLFQFMLKNIHQIITL